jgi:hypothetical protein
MLPFLALKVLEQVVAHFRIKTISIIIFLYLVIYALDTMSTETVYTTGKTSSNARLNIGSGSNSTADGQIAFPDSCTSVKLVGLGAAANGAGTILTIDGTGGVRKTAGTHTTVASIDTDISALQAKIATGTTGVNTYTLASIDASGNLVKAAGTNNTVALIDAAVAGASGSLYGFHIVGDNKSYTVPTTAAYNAWNTANGASFGNPTIFGGFRYTIPTGRGGCWRVSFGFQYSALSTVTSRQIDFSINSGATKYTFFASLNTTQTEYYTNSFVVNLADAATCQFDLTFAGSGSQVMNFQGTFWSMTRLGAAMIAL